MEEKTSGLKMSLARVWERTAAMTGVGRATAHRIVAEKQDGKTTDEPAVTKCVFDDFDQGVVRRTISSMYGEKRMLPTLQNIRTELRERIGFSGGRETLRQELLKMGFTYSTCAENRKVLMEREDVVLSRITYLRAVKELRQAGRTIIYTDETYVHTNHSVKKCWQDASAGLKIPFSKGERMIVLHAGTDTGFIPGADLVFKAHSSSGDYHDDMNQANFTKWLTEKLIPNIPPNSVLVMDNAAYHNVQVDRCPTTSTRKAEIQRWLDRNGISYTPAMLKTELLGLCRSHKQAPVYVVDEILKQHGHTALRLPPYHADLNPIELIWSIFKGFVARNNMSFSMTRIKELIKEGLNVVTADNWRSCIEHVKKKEQQYWASDIACEALQEEIVIHVITGDDSETDTASETEDI